MREPKNGVRHRHRQNALSFNPDSTVIITADRLAMILPDSDATVAVSVVDVALVSADSLHPNPRDSKLALAHLLDRPKTGFVPLGNSRPNPNQTSRCKERTLFSTRHSSAGLEECNRGWPLPGKYRLSNLGLSGPSQVVIVDHMADQYEQ